MIYNIVLASCMQHRDSGFLFCFFDYTPLWAITTKARGGGWEDQPHVQGAVAAWEQEGLEELSYIEGQEGRR